MEMRPSPFQSRLSSHPQTQRARPRGRAASLVPRGLGTGLGWGRYSPERHEHQQFPQDREVPLLPRVGGGREPQIRGGGQSGDLQEQSASRKPCSGWPVFSLLPQSKRYFLGPLLVYCPPLLLHWMGCTAPDSAFKKTPTPHSSQPLMGRRVSAAEGGEETESLAGGEMGREL